MKAKELEHSVVLVSAAVCVVTLEVSKLSLFAKALAANPVRTPRPSATPAPRALSAPPALPDPAGVPTGRSCGTAASGPAPAAFLRIDNIKLNKTLRNGYFFTILKKNKKIVPRGCKYLVVRVDGVRVEMRRGRRAGGSGRHYSVRHVRRHPSRVARLPPLAGVVQHLEVLPAHDGQLLVVVGGAGVRDAHHAAAARLHAARPRRAQLVCNARLGLTFIPRPEPIPPILIQLCRGNTNRI